MPDLSRDPVPVGYSHRPKVVVPRPELVAGGTRFKWYDLRYEEYVIGDALAQESRTRIVSDVESTRIDFGSTMGFVILHIGVGVAMLMVMTWRCSNEIWQTVYLKDLPANSAYEPFERRGHLPTFCVWELGIVWHERNAFERYLYSKRDDAAANEYFADTLSGSV